MLVSFFCLKKLLLLLLCVAGFGHADNLYVWPDTNLASEENWSKGRLPCAGEQVDLSSSTSPLVSSDVRVELAADAGLLTLPTNATLVLEDGFALTSTRRGEPSGRCAGEPEPNRFLPQPRGRVARPRRLVRVPRTSSHTGTGGSDADWTTGSTGSGSASVDESGFRSPAVWTRDAWRSGGRRSECIRFIALVRSLTPLLLLPCAHDAALLPPNSTVLLSLTSPLGKPPEVGRLFIDSTPHTTSSFADLMNTDMGKLQFAVAFRRPRPLTINVEPSRCPSCLRADCRHLLSSASASALCARYNLSTCPATTASTPSAPTRSFSSSRLARAAPSAATARSFCTCGSVTGRRTHTQTGPRISLALRMGRTSSPFSTTCTSTSGAQSGTLPVPKCSTSPGC